MRKALGLVCPYCGMGFTSYDKLMNHRVKHTEGKIVKKVEW